MWVEQELCPAWPAMLRRRCRGRLLGRVAGIKEGEEEGGGVSDKHEGKGTCCTGPAMVQVALRLMVSRPLGDRESRVIKGTRGQR